MDHFRRVEIKFLAELKKTESFRSLKAFWPKAFQPHFQLFKSKKIGLRGLSSSYLKVPKFPLMSWRFWRLNLTTRFFKIQPLISLMVTELHFQLAQAKVECEMVWRGLCYKIDAVSEGGTHARRLLLFGDLGWSCIGSRRAELRFEEARSDDGCFSTFATAHLWTYGPRLRELRKRLPKKNQKCSSAVQHICGKLCFLSSAEFLGISLTYFPIVVLWCPFFSWLTVLITERGVLN